MWKSNVKNIFHIPRWPVRVSNHMVLWGVSWLGNHLPHASTQPAVGAAKHHRQNAYLTAMLGHYIGRYVTTEYAFNLRLISSISIDNNTNTLSRDWMQRVAHALIGPRNCSSWHTFEAGSLPYSSDTLRYMIWKGWGNSLKCNSANFSATWAQSGGIPARGVMTFALCLMLQK